MILGHFSKLMHGKGGEKKRIQAKNEEADQDTSFFIVYSFWNCPHRPSPLLLQPICQKPD
ncbi:hypothetical protein KIS4809_4456 [Bacillus sp. ZZV12-4809]|nr:hypothetical protein KIS4809_4456 [Bacillus sp. ZZV12-4809]